MPAKTRQGHSKNRTWMVYKRLVEAREAAIANNLTSLFAYQQPEDGQYRFVATNLEIFWNRYNGLHESLRHFYEVIPEGHPASLYLDIEFPKKENINHPEELMMAILLRSLDEEKILNLEP